MAVTHGRQDTWCLDVTRLLSRAGLGPWTGIDRVEFRYLDHLADMPGRPFALARVTGGYALLDRTAMTALRETLRNDPPESPQAAEHTVRQLAFATPGRWQLRAALRKALPPGCGYLNVGHSNLARNVFQAVRSVPGSRILVFLHDTIPLDFPQFQRRGTAKRFARKFRLAVACADRVVCPSQASRSDVLRHAGHIGKRPPVTVAPLGVDLAPPNRKGLPASLKNCGPYFVSVGTIEPRKNHALLLSLWDGMAGRRDAPALIIAGRRGWNNQAVFAALDAAPAKVLEFGSLGDGEVSALIAGSLGLLFPSFAEGFGLPACEAAAHGTPVICSDLPVFHEVLGDYAIYADPSNLYSWATKIQSLANRRITGNNENRGQERKPKLPTWEDHFGVVFGKA